MVEELLNKYDLYHSSVISGGKIKFNINYLPDGNIYISLVALINDNEMKATVDTVDDDDFKNFYLPKIIQRFFSKNALVNTRKIMGNNTQGTIIVQRKDLKDSLIIRNCSIDVMDKVELLHNCLSFISNHKVDSLIIFDEAYRQTDNYMKYNVLFDYAYYKNKVFNNTYELSQEELLLLNVARYAYTYDDLDVENVWEEVRNSFKGVENVSALCDAFKNNDYKEDNEYSRALTLAEFEKNNGMLIQNNRFIVEEADRACKEGANFFDNSFFLYWAKKQKESKKAANEGLEAICIDFIDSHDLFKGTRHIEKTPKKKENVDLVSKIKQIKEEKNSFANIINNPITEEDNIEDTLDEIFFLIDKDQMKKDADFEARRIMELEKERDELKSAADEYARIIFKNSKDFEMIQESARIQALRIIELEKQNEELKKMADENAKYIFEREKLYQDEAEKRNEEVDTPVKSQDVDKINNLLYAISAVKNIDFSVNHPTTMQELAFLEEKIVTYLTTHKNIVHEEDTIVPIEKEEMLETKPVIELLSMIRNTYVSSHNFEKDGRHTLISFNPVDEDTFRVSLFSIKDDEEDLLMDAFFEEYQLTDKVLQELCSIYKDGAVIVASKTDNVPPDKADFLAIDNMNNAIRFMDCKKDLIEKVKAYI